MTHRKRWTEEDQNTLTELWGQKSIETISETLGRTPTAIKLRVFRLGLPPFLDSGDYVTLSLLLKILTGSAKTYSCKRESWLRKRGLPVHTKKQSEQWTVRVVYMSEFWAWAEKHRSFLDFSKLEPLALGKEPAWVKEQRAQDFREQSRRSKAPWSPMDDDRLRHYIGLHRYGYREIAEMLNRTEGAVVRRCRTLGIDHPVRVPPKGRTRTWEPEALEALAQGIRDGKSYAEIGRIIGKSEKAIRGKVYTTYLTEVEDQVRALIGDGAWGDNRPVPSVWIARNLSEYRSGTRRELSALAGLLRYRAHELGYEPYWQRFQCVNWDPNHGCLAGAANCDECEAFRRIPPQYCSRCGRTFYEREEARFCAACRSARKKQGFRKYLREAGRIR